MAVLQYVGARYVPKLFDDGKGGMEWQADTYYEPLTVVTYNNASYISRVPVSATTGNPAQNPTEWAGTGSYNGFIASLQEQIDAVNTTLGGKIQQNSDDILYLKHKNLTGQHIILMGDSYGTAGYGDWAGQLITMLQSLGATAYNRCVPGANFRNYYEQLSQFDSAPKDTITQILWMGGINDRTFTENLMVNGIDAILHELPSFPNATFKMAYVGMITSTGERYLATNSKILMGRLAKARGIIWYDKGTTVLHDRNDIASDGVHPTAAGGKKLAAYGLGLLYGHEEPRNEIGVQIPDYNYYMVDGFIQIVPGSLSLEQLQSGTYYDQVGLQWNLRFLLPLSNYQTSSITFIHVTTPSKEGVIGVKYLFGGISAYTLFPVTEGIELSQITSFEYHGYATSPLMSCDIY